MTLSEELVWRGLIKDTTFSDITWLDQPKTFYLGADAGSADSLTIGNLAIFILARRLIQAGWGAVLLMGGATSMIGDPGGKTSERDLVSKDQIQKNVDGIKKQVQNLFLEKPFTIVNNYEWFAKLGYLDFLRDIGKHYSMTELLQRDYIADRIGEGGGGISYAEFSYSLIQGYDFLHLYKNHDVVLQIGGSDQWGNMLSGVPLIRKKESAEVHAMSMPLVINKTTNVKFGKSEDGAIWLDAAKTSPYAFYQFWINTVDDSAEDYLKIYTDLDKDTIDDIMDAHNEALSNRLAQKRLAYEVTTLVHGQQIAESVQRASEVLFGGQDYQHLTEGDFTVLKTELIYAEGPSQQLVDLLVTHGLAKSKTEARQFLESNAIYVNGQQISLNKSSVDNSDTIHGYVIIRRGKNQQMLYKIIS